MIITGLQSSTQTFLQIITKLDQSIAIKVNIYQYNQDTFPYSKYFLHQIQLKPLVSKYGISYLIIPMLLVNKDDELLIECILDPDYTNYISNDSFQYQIKFISDNAINISIDQTLKQQIELELASLNKNNIKKVTNSNKTNINPIRNDYISSSSNIKLSPIILPNLSNTNKKI